MLKLDTGRSFMKGSSGRWAGERFMKALSEGRPISPAELRDLGTLQRDEWIFYDQQLIEATGLRLVGVADLVNAGLVRTIPNGLAKTVLMYEKMTDMEPAGVSMDGMAQTDNDRVEFEEEGLPLPITHKDFFINLRTLLASREKGEGLDATQVRIAGRKIAEMTEQMLFIGGKTFQGKVIYGYTTHPNRNITAFGTNGNWVQVAKTGENITQDVLTLRTMLEADKMYGPYWLYISRNMSEKLDTDFKAATSGTIRSRILEIEGIAAIRTVDPAILPDNNVLLIQASSDVIQMVSGEPLQTIQWDIQGGFQVNFKAFQIMVPLIRTDSDLNSGIAHMS